MDSTIEFCIDRANSEIVLSSIIYKLSDDIKIKKEIFNLEENITFYSAVISHAYYAIFYSAKYYLLSKSLST